MAWSWVDTEYSIHRVQHTLSTALKDCLSSLHSHDYELTPEWSFSFRRASIHDRPPSASSPWELKGKVTLSHSLGCELTNWWNTVSAPGAPSIDCPQVLVQSCSITASKCISKLARLRPPSSHDHGLQVHLQTRSIMASKCISQLARSRPPSTSLMSDSGCTEIQGWRRWTERRGVHISYIDTYIHRWEYKLNA